MLEMASSIDWSDSDPSEAWTEAARGSLITILEIMDQVPNKGGQVLNIPYTANFLPFNISFETSELIAYVIAYLRWTLNICDRR